MNGFDFVLFLFLSDALHYEQGMSFAKVISQPSNQYVYKNNSTMLNCLNATEDGIFINYIKQSEWYRVYLNGSGNLITARYGDSSTIFVHMYALVFTAVEEGDQGQYKCCTTADETSCSVPTTVSIAEDPIMNVTSTHYSGFIESNITLACKIIYVGKPPAKFRWRRNGRYVSDDFIYTNSTYTFLKLTDLVEEDSGLYRCVSDAVLAFHSYSIYLHLQILPKLIIYGPALVISGTMVHINCTQLEGSPSNDLYITTPQGVVIPNSQTIFNATVNDTGTYTCIINTTIITIVEEYYLFVYDVDDTTRFLTFLVILRNADCDTLKELIYANNISISLEKYINDQACTCNVSVIPIKFTCSDSTKAVYNVQITGHRARNVQEYLYDHHQSIQIDVQIATLYVCDQFCEQSDPDINVKVRNENANITEGYNDDHTIAISLASCALTLLAISILIVVAYSILKRIKKHYNCVAREETSIPERHSQELIAGVTSPSSIEYETNDLPNAQIESDQNTVVTYTNNPVYESSHIYNESTVAAQCIVPVEAKRNEEYMRSNITRDVDASHAHMKRLAQNDFVFPISEAGSSMPASMLDHSQSSLNFETTTASSHPAKTNARIHQVARKAATKSVPVHNMAKPLSPRIFSSPYETDV